MYAPCTQTRPSTNRTVFGPSPRKLIPTATSKSSHVSNSKLLFCRENLTPLSLALSLSLQTVVPLWRVRQTNPEAGSSALHGCAKFRTTANHERKTHNTKTNNTRALFSCSLSLGQFPATKLYESNFPELRRTVFATNLRMYEWELFAANEGGKEFPLTFAMLLMAKCCYQFLRRRRRITRRTRTLTRRWTCELKKK